MPKSFKALGLAVSALALTYLPAAAQTKVTNEGISATEIVIGTHQDLSGPVKDWGVSTHRCCRFPKRGYGGVRNPVVAQGQRRTVETPQSSTGALSVCTAVGASLRRACPDALWKQPEARYVSVSQAGG